MGEITDALRRARQEQGGAGPEPLEIQVHEPPDLGHAPLSRESADHLDALHSFTDWNSRNDGEEKEGSPIEIPRTRDGSWMARAVVVDSNGIVAERVRHFGLRVRQALEERGVNTVLVTSALRQEGKTTTSCNLALALASMAAGRRIALVDLDLRRPTVAQGIGISPTVGFQEVMRGTAPLGAACIRTDIPSLDLYLVDEPLWDAHEQLASPRFETIVQELRRRYDTVLFDTPPVLLVPDVPLILPQVGAVVLVARAGVTRRANFLEVLEYVPAEKTIGCFLNNARSRINRKQYGYYLSEGERKARRKR